MPITGCVLHSALERRTAAVAAIIRLRQVDALERLLLLSPALPAALPPRTAVIIFGFTQGRAVCGSVSGPRVIIGVRDAVRSRGCAAAFTIVGAASAAVALPVQREEKDRTSFSID